MLVAFARMARGLEQARSRRAHQKAEQLEAFAFAALFSLTHEIAALPEARNAADRRAAGHLQVTATMLGLLALWAQRLKVRLASGAAHAALDPRARAGDTAPARAPVYTPAYLDSG